MSYCKAFVLASLFALTACMDGSSDPQQPADPQEILVESATALPSCTPGDEFRGSYELGVCGECKQPNGFPGQAVRPFVACASDVQGTKVFQLALCGSCFTVPPPP